MKQNEMKAYASSFVSYLIRKLASEISKIDRIILYGSVAKGEATEKSDIDIFIDTKNKTLENKIKKISKEFDESREAAIFKVKGMANEISVKVGELRQWKELHHSITSGGIILWGRFEARAKPIGTKHKIVFYWEKIERNRGAFLNRVYGFRIKGKKYQGMLEKIGGTKIGKSSVLIPINYKEEMTALLKKYKARAKQKEVFVLD